MGLGKDLREELQSQTTSSVAFSARQQFGTAVKRLPHSSRLHDLLVKQMRRTVPRPDHGEFRHPSKCYKYIENSSSACRNSQYPSILCGQLQSEGFAFMPRMSIKGP